MGNGYQSGMYKPNLGKAQSQWKDEKLALGATEGRRRK